MLRYLLQALAGLIIGLYPNTQDINTHQIDSIGDYSLYSAKRDSLFVLEVFNYYDHRCIYDQGLSIKTIRIKFPVGKDSVHCSRYSYFFDPHHQEVLGVKYICTVDTTTLFISIDAGVDSVEEVKCNSHTDIMKELFGDSVIAQIEKDCSFLPDKYKPLYLKYCSFKAYDRILIATGFAGTKLYAAYSVIYCFSLTIFTKDSNLITYIRDNVDVEVKFKFRK